MIKNRKFILLIIISLVFFYIMIILFPYVFGNKNYKKTVFLGSTTKVNIDNKNIEIYNEDKKIIKQNVKIYFDNKFIDGYISSGNAESSGVTNYYYFYNSNGDSLISENGLIAHTNDLSIKIKESEKNIINDLEELNNFAKTNGIIFSADLELLYSEVDYIDVDNDDTNESIYSFDVVDNDSKYYSFVFMKKDDKYLLISKESEEYNGMPGVSLSFLKLIDFNNDGNYEFVVEKMMSEYGPNYYELYNFDGSKFIKIGGE